MGKKVWIWLIIATVLVLAGVIMLVSVIAACSWDFSRLSTEQYQTNTYTVSEEFRDISIKTETADILFAASDDGTCKVVCYEKKNLHHSAVVRDGSLTIRVTDERKWYEYIGIFSKAPKLTIYLPETEYAALFIEESTGDIDIPAEFRFDSMDITTSTGDVKSCASVTEMAKIETSTGDISVADASVNTLALSVTTGDVTVSDVVCEGDVKVDVTTGRTKITDTECKNLKTDGSTGDVFLKNVIAMEKFLIERDTGDVRFDGCDAAQLLVETDTGDISGSLLSEKEFIADSDTGRVDVPRTGTGGLCELSTDTGDIRITIE